MERQEYEAQQSIARLPQLQQDYYREMLIEMFSFNALKEKEDYLLRLLLEFFAGQNPSLVQLHRQASANLQTSIVEVAQKWTNTLLAMTFEQLQSEPLTERVKRSATYFADTLKATLDNPLELTKTVKSNNKEALRRLGDTCSELIVHYRWRLLLLKAMAEKDFSISTYLRERQRSLVIAMGKPEKEGNPKKEKKKKKEKEQKEKTWVTSYNLYRQGKSIADIAVERMLTPQTIVSHLGRYVETGEIPIESLVPTDHIAIIRKAISEVGTTEGKNAIKSVCPDDISYSEIDIVLRTYEQASDGTSA